MKPTKRRCFGIALFVVALALATAARAANPVAQAVVKVVKPSVVFIHTKSGSGYVVKKRVTPGEFKRWKTLIEQHDLPFKRLKSATGLTDDIVAEMTKTLLDKVNAKIER